MPRLFCTNSPDIDGFIAAGDEELTWAHKAAVLERVVEITVRKPLYTEAQRGDDQEQRMEIVRRGLKRARSSHE